MKHIEEKDVKEGKEAKGKEAKERKEAKDKGQRRNLSVSFYLLSGFTFVLDNNAGHCVIYLDCTPTVVCLACNLSTHVVTRSVTGTVRSISRIVAHNV